MKMKGSKGKYVFTKTKGHARQLGKAEFKSGYDATHKSVKVDYLPKCDFCDSEAGYDGKTNTGPWANMCSNHFKQHGVGLGLGKGQKLILEKPMSTQLGSEQNNNIWKKQREDSMKKIKKHVADLKYMIDNYDEDIYDEDAIFDINQKGVDLSYDLSKLNEVYLHEKRMKSHSTQLGSVKTDPRYIEAEKLDKRWNSKKEELGELRASTLYKKWYKRGGASDDLNEDEREQWEKMKVNMDRLSEDMNLIWVREHELKAEAELSQAAKETDKDNKDILISRAKFNNSLAESGYKYDNVPRRHLGEDLS